jgi:hypothetical protein
MDKEEKELQIKLAKLQVDVQVSLTLMIGFFTVFASYMIYSSQMYNTLPESNPLRYSYGLATPVAIFGLIAVSIFGAISMGRKRREIEELSDET